MPGGDGSGPVGYGPKTGRGRGYCDGFRVPGFLYPGYGRGAGGGRGMRRAYHCMPYSIPFPYNPYYKPAVRKEEEVGYLKDLAKALEEELDAVKEQIRKLGES